jgi:hypothetical protein
VVYTAGSLALASLEMLAHVDAGELPTDLLAIPAEFHPVFRAKRSLVTFFLRTGGIIQRPIP